MLAFNRPCLRLPTRGASLLAMLALAACLAITTSGYSASPPSGAHPNIVLIYTDDHGIGDVSAYRSADLKTPHIDRIAKEGMLFTTMRANCTVCSPSRAALLTGMYADRVGVPGVIRTRPQDSWGYFSPNVPTLADALNKSGYHTALIGKWHLGLESPNLPNERGFQHFHGFLGDMMDSYISHKRHGNDYMRLNDTPVQSAGRHATDLFTDWTLDYLNDRANTPEHPFFLFLSYNAPHFPIEPPKEWLQKVRERQPELTELRAKNVAFVEHLDAAIGRVLEALDNLKLTQNTIVVFTSDNGGSLPHGQNNDPWRDGKQSHYDGGLRVPFLVRWPGKLQPGSRSDYAGLVFDLFPTFVEVAAAPPSPDLDAVSLLPVFRGESPTTMREMYFVRREGNNTYGGKSYHALIQGDWKLLHNTPFAPYELYNLRTDPEETTNVAQKHPDIFKKMTASLRVHIQRGGATPWQKPSTKN